ncbi:hypothetical protein GCM10023264_23860 [Sphingomonas daechungensis]|uniref:Lipoprotein n=1 Tax=Sphingomonas daechungensis TaxID=1176646 RepID=A0ABX6T3V0_9SPHN|nr:hypothetical protein [Sphingomonas daechungensis]QNP43587.1 hypothetical protein H9L15_02305 [Sphingomonas daechungensis]
MRIFVVALGAILAGCSAPPPNPANDAPIAEIAGRIAGPPKNCVLIEQGVGLNIVNRNTLTLHSGRTMYVNQVQGNCGGFRKWDVLVVEPIGTQYCKGDLVRSFDPVSKIPGPTCRLGDFIPYTKG